MRRRGINAVHAGKAGEKHPLPSTTPPVECEVPKPIRIQSVALTMFSALAAIALLRYAQELFVPLALSMLLAFALNPFVSALERFHVHRTVASVLVVIAMFAAIGTLAYGLRNQASTVVENVPKAIGKLRDRLQRYREGGAKAGPIGKIQEAAKELEKAASEAATPPAQPSVPKVEVAQPLFRPSEYLWASSLGLIGLASNCVLVAFLVFFLLASGDLFKRKLVRIIGNTLAEKRVTVETLNEINAQIGRFLLIQIVTCIAVGICTAVALWAFGVNQPAFWGAVAGMLCVVPYLGPIFVTIALAVIAFLQFDSIAVAGEIAAIPAMIFSLEGLLLKPAVMGKAARMNGVAMFVGLLFWSWIWGLIGMIVAVPIMMVIKCVCDRVEALRPLGELLGA
jgi:predicted PurR-regulated permease PerM